ncbi:MAG: mandelate racemase/muconate lactonizing enzyme family protein [Verrucomicrobia bacterium]|nr:mandelate racemase/muconate lactonizing enzyme family protein [Verrucomicrobiota bacterium]
MTPNNQIVPDGRLKIDGFEIFVVKVPNCLRRWLFLLLKTNNGNVGYGECCWHGDWPGILESATIYVEEIKLLLRRFVLGKSPYIVEKLWQDFYLSGHSSRVAGPVNIAAFSAIEIACWDLIGKELGQPVYNLLGGMVRDKVRTYCYLPGPFLGADPKAIAERAVAQLERGYTATKLDPVEEFVSEDTLPRLDEVEAIIKAIREAVGSRCDLMLGTHGQFDTHTAIRFAKRLEPYELAWFEEPVPPEDVEAMSRVARATSIPIAAGERLMTKFSFAKLMERQAVSIYQPDPNCCGGILETKKIAALADCHYAVIAPHMYGGPLSLAASIQVDVCTTNFYIQENNVLGFHDEVLKEPVRWERGFIKPSPRPGLGYELNMAVVLKHSEVRSSS